MWIRARSAKSLGLLVALFVSLFVFVIAAGEARAEEQGGLPGTQWPQWCAAPPDGRGSATSPTDQDPAGGGSTNAQLYYRPEARLLRPPNRRITWFAALPRTRPAARSQGRASHSQGRAYLPPQVGGRVGREAGALRCGEHVGPGTFSNSGLGGRAFNGALGGRTARAACPP